jgi:RNA polymerase sigma-70 factor (ECF subfamily)
MAVLQASTSYDLASEAELVAAARAREPGAFQAIMRNNNRRLYRVARAVLGDDAEAEDVVQEAYLKAFQNLASFRGESSLTTWLTRIAVNEALGRRRRRRPTVDLCNLDVIDEQGEARVLISPNTAVGANPENDASRVQVRRLLERAIDELPEIFRTVFVMREVEQMSVEETASQLNILPETVKTRLHRARRLLRTALKEHLSSVDTYAFGGERCQRMTRAVMKLMGVLSETKDVKTAG